LSSSQDDLQGIALQLYVTLVNSNKPLGPRELTRLASLSSPSVAYRNLQKLEELGLVEKNPFGEYTIKQRQNVKGHLLFAGHLFPRMVFYAFFFVGLLSVEAVLAVARLMVGQVFTYDFILLIIVTVIAMALFLLEGALSKIAK
jgi:hypothetical protein